MVWSTELPPYRTHACQHMYRVQRQNGICVYTYMCYVLPPSGVWASDVQRHRNDLFVSNTIGVPELRDMRGWNIYSSCITAHTVTTQGTTSEM